MAKIFERNRADRISVFRNGQNIPRSYIQNSKVEDDLVSFVDSFSVQFHKYYPDRKPLLLTAQNECGKRKMISTYVRPTVLKYDELYDLEKCCRYVAGYMVYEPLYSAQVYEDPNDDTKCKLPTQINSPATVLQWQIGNCVELSLVLTSLLSGAGYNSYVVVGYAKKAVCLNDQSEETWEDDLPIEYNSDDEPEPEPEIEDEYAALLKKKPKLRQVSDPDPQYNFDIGLNENSKSSKSGSIGNHENMSVKYKSVHSWVLVLPGGRKTVKEPLLIEPSTGKVFPFAAADYSYVGIESVFNHKRYCVNLHPEALVSSLSTDLQDATQWENVFPPVKDNDEIDNFGGTLGQTTTLLGLTSRRALNATTMEASSAESPDDNWKPGLHIPIAWGSELTLNLQQYETRYPGGSKEIQYADATVRLYADYVHPDLRVKEVLIADDLYRDDDQIHIFFKHRADKLRRRLVLPHDKTSASSPIQQQLANIPNYRLLHEWYDRGRTKDSSFEGLREFIYQPGKERLMKFYWRSREDGLYTRLDAFYDEQTFHRSREVYKNRRDRLRQQSAVYERPRTIREANVHQTIVLTGVGAGVKEMKEYPRLDPSQISLKYTRNPAVPADTDVAKVKFIIPPPSQAGSSPGEMQLFFHYPANSIVRPYHFFGKPSSNVEDYIASSVSKKVSEPPVKVVTLPGAAPPSELKLYEERKWLAGLEATSLGEVRKRLDDAFDLLLRRDKEQAEVVPVLSSYDTLRNRPLETEAERARKLADAARREESRKDYLAPYIAKLNLPAGFDGNYLNVRLNLDQAKQVRDEALLELKERLIQRGRIMQTRMDREKEEFSHRQMLFQKSGESSAIEGSTEAEEFAIYCKEATWRMKVLDERLSKHITLASEKYAQLAQRLSEDPRLIALYG